MEVWTQNSVTSPTNRLAIMKAILRGETLTTFETAVAEEQKGADGAILNLTMGMLEEALAEVTMSIFPHKALDSQKQWMKKYIKKPRAC